MKKTHSFVLAAIASLAFSLPSVAADDAAAPAPAAAAPAKKKVSDGEASLNPWVDCGIGAMLFEAAAMGMHSLITREPALTPLLYLLPAATLAVAFMIMRVRRWPTFVLPRLARAT